MAAGRERGGPAAATNTMGRGGGTFERLLGRGSVSAWDAPPCRADPAQLSPLFRATRAQALWLGRSFGGSGGGGGGVAGPGVAVPPRGNGGFVFSRALPWGIAAGISGALLCGCRLQQPERGRVSLQIRPRASSCWRQTGNPSYRSAT